MASLFKRSDKVGAHWFVSYYYVTATGTKRRRIVSTGTAEHKVAKQIAAKHESDAAVRSHGVIDVRLELLQKNSKLKIESLLPDFENKMKRKAKAGSEKNTTQTLGYIRRFMEFAKVQTIGQIHADDVQRFKVSLFALNLSARTVQANVNALKHFTNWLVDSGKLGADPLLSIDAPNPQDDRRKERRMLLPTEWAWLIRGVLQLGTKRGMCAESRILLYRLTIQTGLRSNELRSLKRGSFTFGDRPFVRVASASTKNSQVAYQYIDSGLAGDLERYLASKHPNAAAFTLPSASRVVDMIRDDLQAGRQLWLDEVKANPQEYSQRLESDFLEITNGVGQCFDFHSLRHTCGAWLAMRGVQPKVIQSVMRHSTITLTMDTYGHLIEGAEAIAVASSAELTAIPILATGTDGGRASSALPTAVRGACFDMLGNANLGQSAANLMQQKTPHKSMTVRGYACSMHRYAKRRARESNPQLLSQRLISNQLPNHSVTLRTAAIVYRTCRFGKSEFAAWLFLCDAAKRRPASSQKNKRRTTSNDSNSQRKPTETRAFGAKTLEHRPTGRLFSWMLTRAISSRAWMTCFHFATQIRERQKYLTNQRLVCLIVRQSAMKPCSQAPNEAIEQLTADSLQSSSSARSKQPALVT